MFSGPAQEDKSGIYRLLCRAYAVGICKDDLVGGERSPVWLQKIAALISTSETRTCSTEEQRNQAAKKEGMVNKVNDSNADALYRLAILHNELSRLRAFKEFLLNFVVIGRNGGENEG